MIVKDLIAELLKQPRNDWWMFALYVTVALVVSGTIAPHRSGCLSRQRAQAILDLAEARLRDPQDPNTKHDLTEIARPAREALTP